jgi:hypothetical protein
VRDHVLEAQERSHHVEPQHRLEVGAVEAVEREELARTSGIGHEPVDRPGQLEGLAHRAGDRSLVGDVGHDRVHAPALGCPGRELLARRVQRGGGTPADRHRRTLLDQELGAGAPEPGRAAGHDVRPATDAEAVGHRVRHAPTSPRCH